MTLTRPSTNWLKVYLLLKKAMRENTYSELIWLKQIGKQMEQVRVRLKIRNSLATSTQS